MALIDAFDHPTVAAVEAMYPGALDAVLKSNSVRLLAVRDNKGLLSVGLGADQASPYTAGVIAKRFSDASRMPLYSTELIDAARMYVTRLDGAVCVSSSDSSHVARRKSVLALDADTAVRALKAVCGSVRQLHETVIAGSSGGSLVATVGNGAIYEIQMTDILRGVMTNLISNLGFTVQLSAPIYLHSAGFNATGVGSSPTNMFAVLDGEYPCSNALVPHATARYLGIGISITSAASYGYPGATMATAVDAAAQPYANAYVLYIPVVEYGSNFDDVQVIFCNPRFAADGSGDFAAVRTSASFVQSPEARANRQYGVMSVGRERFQRGAGTETAALGPLFPSAIPAALPEAPVMAIWAPAPASAHTIYERAAVQTVVTLLGPPKGIDYAFVGAVEAWNASWTDGGNTLYLTEVTIAPEIRMRRVHWETLVSYWTNGLGVYQGLSSAELDAAKAQAADLTGKSISTVSTTVGYTVPSDIVSRIALHVDYASAMERNCMEDDFLEQNYDSLGTVKWGDIDRYYSSSSRVVFNTASLTDSENFDSTVVLSVVQKSVVGVKFTISASGTGAVLLSAGTTLVDVKDGALVADYLCAGAPLTGTFSLLDYVFGNGYAAALLSRMAAEKKVNNVTSGYSDASGNTFDFSGVASSYQGWPVLQVLPEQDAWKAVIYSDFMLKGVNSAVTRLLETFRPVAIVSRLE